MIIGISGKNQNDNDTVGKIIQYLTSKQPLQVSIEEFITKDYWLSSSVNITFQIKKFTDKLKDIVCLLIGCTREQLEDIDFKNSKLPDEWNKPEGVGIYDIMMNLLYQEVFTYRMLLQYLGTDLLRNQLHKDVWVNALFNNYKVINMISIPNDDMFNGDSYTELIYPNWIITDVRFPNEAKAIKDRGGILLRVNRGKTSKQWQELYPDIIVLDPDGWSRDRRFNFEWNEQLITLEEYKNRLMRSTCKFKVKFEDYFKEHKSETALDNAKFDYVIDNNGTIEELIEKVKEILIKEKII